MAKACGAHGHSICRNCYGYFCPTKSGPNHPHCCPDCGACMWVYLEGTAPIANAVLLFYLRAALKRAHRLEVDDVAG